MGDILDLSELTDDKLIEMARAVAAEVRRRGAHVEAAASAAVLGEAEKAQIAAEAATREARRLAEEEARRVAVEAAERVRREAEYQKADTEARKARDAAERLRKIAREARSLFGSDEPEFTIARWEKPGDRRIYIGHGYGNNWVEYHHDGNDRTAPGTMKAIGAVVNPLAAHLGVAPKEAREKIVAFCRGLIEHSFYGSLEVNPSNAPLDPAAVDVGYALKWERPAATGDGSRTSGVTVCYAGDKGSPLPGRYTTVADRAQTWKTPEAARAAVKDFACALLPDPSVVEIEPRSRRVPFPPKPQAPQAQEQEAARA
jgi:hypothetical protein